VDRRALPAPDASRPDLAAGYVAPSTPAEEAVADIWREVLGAPRVGVHDDFFSLGGHSLLAARVISRINADAGVGLTLRAIFESPTVATLAAAVDHARTSGAVAAPALRRIDRAMYRAAYVNQPR